LPPAACRRGTAAAPCHTRNIPSARPACGAAPAWPGTRKGTRGPWWTSSRASWAGRSWRAPGRSPRTPRRAAPCARSWRASPWARWRTWGGDMPPEFVLHHMVGILAMARLLVLVGLFFSDSRVNTLSNLAPPVPPSTSWREVDGDGGPRHMCCKVPSPLTSSGSQSCEPEFVLKYSDGMMSTCCKEKE